MTDEVLTLSGCSHGSQAQPKAGTVAHSISTGVLQLVQQVLGDLAAVVGVD